MDNIVEYKYRVINLNAREGTEYLIGIEGEKRSGLHQEYGAIKKKL